MPDLIQGVTRLFDKLYVLHTRDADQVEVYTTEPEYMPVRCISVSGLDNIGVCDIVSCEQNKSLYLSNKNKKHIHVIVPKGNSSKTSKWTLSEIPCGLSATLTGNLLVTCLQSRKLLELSPRGKCIRTIIPDSEFPSPIHSIQLASGNFVICFFGGAVSGLTMQTAAVCIVNPEGKVEQSYAGGEVQLNYPTHIAVDKDDFVYVADRNNARIVLLSPSLKFVSLVLPNELQRRTNHVYIDHAASRLYASSNMFDSLQRRGVLSVAQL